MSRILVALATVLILCLIFFGAQGLSSIERDSNEDASDTAITSALQQTAAIGTTSPNGAQLRITGTSAQWNAQLFALSSGATTSFLRAFRGNGSVALVGGTVGTPLTVTTSKTGEMTATQGAVTATCPMSFVVDGSLMQYEC